MMRFYLPLLLCMLAIAVELESPTPATAQSSGSKVTSELKFEITATDVAFVALDVLLPRNEAYRQKVLRIDYSLPPTHEFEKDSQKYAQFQITKFPAELTIKIEAEVYRYDLTTARRRLQRGAETRESLAPWLVFEQYLETNSRTIREVSDKLTGSTEEATVAACFDYVVNNLTKTRYTDKDIGAARTLHTRSGDCTEFADLFIALCRSKGIPARFCQGYLLEPVLDTPRHDWAEVYLKDHGWVPFDPVYTHLGLKTSYSQLRPIYLRIERERRNSVLNHNHFWAYRYEGNGEAKVKDAFTVFKREELPAK